MDRGYLRAWVAVLIGVLAITAHTASSYTLSILMKPILAELRWDRTTFASAMTVRMFLMVLTLSLAGQVTDRFGTRIVLAVGSIIVGLGTLGIANAHSLASLYPAMALMGPGQACIGPVAASALVLRIVQKQRGLAVGILNGGDNLISAMIPLAAAYLLGTSGWRFALSVLGVAYFVLAALIFLALRAGDGRVDEPAARSAHVRLRDLPWGDWRLWALCLAYAGIYAFITSVQLHLHAYQTDIGRTAEQASRIMSLMIFSGAFGAPIFGVVAQRTGAAAALVVIVIGLMLSSVALWNLKDDDSFVLWAITYGLVNSGVVAVLALVLHQMFGSEQIGRLMGVAMVFCMGATMLANLYSASTFDTSGSYLRVWQSYSVLMALVLVPAIALWRAVRT